LLWNGGEEGLFAYIYSEEEFLLVRISYKMLLNVDLENEEGFYCYYSVRRDLALGSTSTR
jgi:hypothetical protein